MVTDTNVNGLFLMARRAVPVMLAAGRGRIINISMNRQTIRRQGFSPYGPSKAALEFETIIWAQDLADTGVTVNALLLGGASLTGMMPEGVPDIMIEPLPWPASIASDGVTGRRLVASQWNPELPQAGPPKGATDLAGWAEP